MKKIVLKGNGLETKTKRKSVERWLYPKEMLDIKNQIPILNKLYLGQNFEGFVDVQKEIKNKISSYIQQDKKHRFDTTKIITLEQCLEKLVISKLKCYYCRKNTLLMYECKREPLQWTLDRLDNYIGHNKDNVVICCLKCNLKKRRIDDDKFKFTKQMRIIKSNRF